MGCVRALFCLKTNPIQEFATRLTPWLTGEDDGEVHRAGINENTEKYTNEEGLKGEDWNKPGPGLSLILRSHVPRVQRNLFVLCGLGVSVKP